MRIEERTTRSPQGKLITRGIVLIVESKHESSLLDKVFGDRVGEDGLVSERDCECRLSDGYGEHYIYIATERKNKRAKLEAARDKIDELNQHIINQDYALEAVEGALQGFVPTAPDLADMFPVIKTALEFSQKINDEIDSLNNWINDLQSGMYINCVYCGHRYGPSGPTPISMAAVLKAHIEECPKHPASKLKEQVNQFGTALKKAKEIIHLFHGKDGWNIYDRCAPEMQIINKALKQIAPEKGHPEESAGGVLIENQTTIFDIINQGGTDF